MKIVRPMTQADSASSGRASTGGWRAGRQPEGRRWEENRGGWGWREVVRGLRQRRDRGGGGRKDVVSSLQQQEGEEVSCLEEELRAGLDR